MENLNKLILLHCGSSYPCKPEDRKYAKNVGTNKNCSNSRALVVIILVLTMQLLASGSTNLLKNILQQIRICRGRDNRDFQY